MLSFHIFKQLFRTAWPISLTDWKTFSIDFFINISFFCQSSADLFFLCLKEKHFHSKHFQFIQNTSFIHIKCMSRILWDINSNLFYHFSCILLIIRNLSNSWKLNSTTTKTEDPLLLKLPIKLLPKSRPWRVLKSIKISSNWLKPCQTPNKNT